MSSMLDVEYFNLTRATTEELDARYIQKMVKIKQILYNFSWNQDFELSDKRVLEHIRTDIQFIINRHNKIRRDKKELEKSENCQCQ